MATQDPGAIVRSGPLVGAQEFEWWKLRQGISTNVVSQVEPPAGTTRQTAISLLHEALDPFESLRTSFTFDHGGRPLQVVHSVRDFEVCERDAGEGAGAELTEELGHTVFTVDDAVLTRVGMVTDGPHVLCVVLSVSHAIIDGRGAQVLRARLNSVFAGQGKDLTTAEAAPHPIDSATSEHSGPLSRMRDASMRFWEKEIERIPNRLFAPRRGGVIEHYHSEYDSYAANPALVLAGRRFHTSPAIVYTSAIVALAALISGSSTTIVRTHLAGRTPEESNSVGCYHQILPLTVETGDRPSLSQIIERVMSKAFRIQSRYRVGYLDLREAVRREENARGASFAEGITVNFDYGIPGQQLNSDNSALTAELSSSRERELLMGAGESKTDLRGLDAYLLTRLGSRTLHVFGTFNSLTLTTEQMRCLLAGPEQLLTRLLFGGDISWDAMQRMFGERICVNENPDLGRRGLDAFSVKETTEALTCHPDVTRAVLQMDENSGSPSLTAHIETQASHITPEDLRAHVLRRLSPAHPVVCPDRFVINRVAGAEAEMEADGEAARAD
jgi:hypothetical protein